MRSPRRRVGPEEGIRSPGRRGGYVDAPSRGPTTRTALLRTRRAMNWLNLSTPVGLALARAGGARIERGPHGLLLAWDYRSGLLPVRGRAMTIGDVVLLGIPESALVRRPNLLVHEARHAGQYARWLGPAGFFPAYGLASLYSWLRTGHPALRNHFESRAGLLDGGYIHREKPSAPQSPQAPPADQNPG